MTVKDEYALGRWVHYEPQQLVSHGQFVQMQHHLSESLALRTVPCELIPTKRPLVQAVFFRTARYASSIVFLLPTRAASVLRCVFFLAVRCRVLAKVAAFVNLVCILNTSLGVNVVMAIIYLFVRPFSASAVRKLVSSRAEDSWCFFFLLRLGFGRGPTPVECCAWSVSIQPCCECKRLTEFWRGGYH